MSKTRFISQKEWNNLTEDERQELCRIVKSNNKNTDNQLVAAKNDTFYVLYGKRFLDLIIGIPAFVISAPINLIIAIITFFDVGSPILFKQTRIGKDGKLFTLYKFRNMTNETDSKGILLQPECRITKWGRFVRRTSLDELLNFWSVIRGDMSIIGPRPLPEKYFDRFNSYHQQRHLVRPGLDCPLLNKEFYGKKWQGKLDNDIYYLENISLRTDIKMIWLLIQKVFSKEQRRKSATGKTGEFIGYNTDGSVMDEYTIPYEYLIKLKEKQNERI